MVSRVTRRAEERGLQIAYIVNTDQGSQFTSTEFIDKLKENGIAISMDGKGCWRDNVFIERFWRTVKYEEVYLRAYETVSQALGTVGRKLAGSAATAGAVLGILSPESFRTLRSLYHRSRGARNPPLGNRPFSARFVRRGIQRARARLRLPLKQSAELERAPLERLELGDINWIVVGVGVGARPDARAWLDRSTPMEPGSPNRPGRTQRTSSTTRPGPPDNDDLAG